MKPRERLTLAWFFLSFFLAALTAGVELYVFVNMNPEQKQQILELLFPYRYLLLLPNLVLLALVIFGAKWVLEKFWLPIIQLTEEVQVLFSSRTSKHLITEVPPHFQQLVSLLNDQSQRMETLQTGIDTQITQAKNELEKEKNVFAALIEKLREGVIICNLNSSILLYNKAAQVLFLNNDLKSRAEKNSASHLGLGRSLLSIITTPNLKYTLNELRERQRLGSSNLVQHFSTWLDSKLLHVQAIGILDVDNELNGFVFICEDLSPRDGALTPHDALAQLQEEKRRASIANIRSAIETLQDYPEMPPDKQQLLMTTIQQHSLKLGELLEKQTLHNEEELRALCPLELTSIQEWLLTLEKNPERQIELNYDFTVTNDNWNILLNSYFFSEVLEFLFGQLKQAVKQKQLDVRLKSKSQFVLLDICWQGVELPPELLKDWLRHPLKAFSADQNVMISEILRQHDTEIWFEEISANQQCLRLFLPLVNSESNLSERKNINLGSRPVFYDFDLFHQSGSSEKWGDALLKTATYTVFDTETTGLDPAGGDEIISIGAIRIVNGQILWNETFSQLVNPQCKISQQSFLVHGISAELLKDQPLIAQMLPLFHKFAEDSILVAHNAAFDLRFLSMKETATGIVFDNPVLDTLLLSSIIHPNLDKHDLDTLSARFGLEFEQRHSALGDAQVTAEILLQIIPMLESQAILTVQNAQSASQKSPYAQLKY